MYKEYNAHPKGILTSDCVVRAISTATKQDYIECRRDLNRKKRELGFSSYKETKFLYKYLENYLRLIIKIGPEKKRVKGHEFTEIYPKGTYILKMRKHFTVCVDGVILDTWDCTHLSVYTAWRIEE
jgi:hypothetical protein